MRTLSNITIASTALLLLSAASANAFTAWCGNGCSSSQEKGIECTDWEPAGGEGQTCQAKAVCSEGCTIWEASIHPSVDALKITPREAQQLRGARTIKLSKPPVVAK